MTMVFVDMNAFRELLIYEQNSIDLLQERRIQTAPLLQALRSEQVSETKYGLGTWHGVLLRSFEGVIFH